MASKAVSLHVFVDDEETGLQAVCQVRGMFNVETWKQESYRGLLQPAAHGKFKPDDMNDPRVCMLREAGEELGAEFLAFLISLPSGQIQEVPYGGDVKHYTVCVTRAVVQQMRPHPSSTLRLLNANSVAAFDKTLGKEYVIPSGVNAMFADDLAAMEMAWLLWSH